MAQLIADSELRCRRRRIFWQAAGDHLAGRRGGRGLGGLVESRLAELEAKPEMKRDFLREMQRFLPAATLRNTLENPGYWTYLKQVLGDQATLAINALK